MSASSRPSSPDRHHVVEGEMTGLVRLVGLAIGTALAAAILLGLWEGALDADTLRGRMAHGLLVTQIIFAAVLIMLGSLVEGFGFGLALGTRWPYTRNILVLTLRGDPEAAHRVVATGVGLVGVALAVLDPSYEMCLGLAMIVITALFGMGVLHVLAGRAPAVVHGTHGLLAYLVYLAYLVPLGYQDIGLGHFLLIIVPTHALLFSIFMGGIVTGGRGFGEPIGAFATPEKKSQWIFVLHGLAGLVTVGTLGWYAPTYPVAFVLCLVQLAIGFGLFQAVNLKPKAPGVVVAFHQAMALLIMTAVVMQWRF